jgi:hypothetical protein
MANRILIAGTESPLLNALMGEAAKRTEEYAVLSPPQWRLGSALSARSQIMHFSGKLGGIDEAILVCAPPDDANPPTSLSLTQIDDLFDNQIKCWYYLLRELQLAFGKQGHGLVNLVLKQSASLASDSFRSLGEQLLQASQQINYEVNAFVNEGTAQDDSNGFADYIFKILDAGSSKGKAPAGAKRWYRYGKRSLFGL